jgi:iron complex outermembrane receptor protein
MTAMPGRLGAIPGNRLFDYVRRHNWTDEFKLQEKTRQSTAWPT